MKLAMLALMLWAITPTVSDDELRERHIAAVNEIADLRARLAALERRVDEISQTCLRAPEPEAELPAPPARFD